MERNITTFGILLFIFIINFSFGVYGCTFPTYLTAESYDQDLYSHNNWPLSYSSSTDECWVISASFGYVVRIESQSFDLESTTLCGYDYLRLYDGATDSYSYDYVSYCGEGSFTIYSSSEDIYLNFNTDGSIQKEGFHLTYRKVALSDSNYDSDDWTNGPVQLFSGLRWWGILLIVGGVIFLIVVLIIVVVIVVVCCIMSQSKGRVGNGTTHTGGNRTVIAQQQQGGMGQVSYVGATQGVMIQPPAYGQGYNQPPAYNQHTVMAGHMQPQQQQQQQQQFAYQKGAPLTTVQPASQTMYGAGGSGVGAYPSADPNMVPPPPVYNDPTNQ